MVNIKILRASALFVFVILIFGLNYIFVDIGLRVSSPIWLAFFRALLGFAGTVALLLAMKAKGQLTTKQKIIALLLGIPGSALFFGLWNLGGTKVPPGLTSVVIYTFPLWVVILSAILLREKVKPVKAGAVLLGFVGVMLASRIGFININSDIVALIELAVAGFSFALLNTAFKRFYKGQQLLRANMYQLAGSLLPLLVWAALSSPFQVIR